ADAEAATHALERIRAAVAALGPPRIAQRITVSAGVAMHQGLFEKTSLDSLVARADVALYAAKKAGRDRVVVEREPEPTTPADVRYR
ncbi:MAG: diguanylate cyclase domain-containing protein, partial [Thermoanaerobaculia bacterium]